MTFLSRQQDSPLLASSANLTTILSVGTFALSANFDTNELQDIWEVGGERVWPEAASVFELVSDSTEDSAAGLGARTVFFSGVLSGGFANSEIVTLNGTTPVTTAEEYLRVNRVEVLTSGTRVTSTAGANLGIITITHADESLLQGVINGTPHAGRMQNSHFTTPVTHNGFITNIFFSISASTTLLLSADFFLMIRSLMAPDNARIIIGQLTGVHGTHDVNRTNNPLPVGPFVDIWACARRGQNMDIRVQTDFSINLVEL